MKRFLFLITILYSSGVFAQDNPLLKAVSLGAELGIPGFGVYSIGVGVSAKGELPVSDQFAITATAAYSAFFHKDNLFPDSKTLPAATFVPLKAGLKFYANPRVFIEGELGTAIENNYLRRDLFAFSIGPGFIIPIKDKTGVECGLRYEKWSQHQVQQTTIRFAYRLGW